MKEDSLKQAFERLTPSDTQKEAMLRQVLAQGRRRIRRPVWIGVVSSAAAVFLLAAGCFGYALLSGTLPSAKDLNMAGTAGEGMETAQPELALEETDEVLVKGRIYSLREDLRESLNYPEFVAEEELGEAWAAQWRHTSGVSQTTAYWYPKAPGETAVALEQPDGRYRLYLFENFTSYEENGEEDMAAYAAVYGLHSAYDLAEVRIQGENGQEAAIGDPGWLSRFFEEYVGLTEDAEGYFSQLSGGGESSQGEDSYREGYIETTSDDPDALFVEHDMQTGEDRWYKPDPSCSRAPEDEGGEASQTADSPTGLPAPELRRQYTVTVRFASGWERSYLYLPDIGFFERYPATEALAGLLEELIGQLP